MERAFSIGRELGTLLFSAKEAIQSRLSVVAPVDWLEVSVQVDLANTSLFSPAAGLRSGPIGEGDGSFSFQNEVVLTLFRLPPMLTHN